MRCRAVRCGAVWCAAKFLSEVDSPFTWPALSCFREQKHGCRRVSRGPLLVSPSRACLSFLVQISSGRYIYPIQIDATLGGNHNITLCSLVLALKLFMRLCHPTPLCSLCSPSNARSGTSGGVDRSTEMNLVRFRNRLVEITSSPALLFRLPLQSSSYVKVCIRPSAEWMLCVGPRSLPPAGVI